jgi:hypothetical protein
MIVNDATCLFCAEDETVNHLFFYCCVAELSGKIYLILWTFLWVLSRSIVVI